MLNIFRMHRTISKKIKLSKKFTRKKLKKKFTKKKLKHKDGVIMYYHKGGVSKSQFTRLNEIIFKSMSTDITNILCGTTSPDIIYNVFNLTKDTELLGSFARAVDASAEPKPSDQKNDFFKVFQNYFFNNDNAIYEVFVNGMIKEAMKKYNLELLGFNYIGNENEFKLKKIQDVDYDDWKRISKRINILIESNVHNTTCEQKHLREIRTEFNWFDLSPDKFDFNIENISELVITKFVEAFKDLGVKDIAVQKIKEKGANYVIKEVLPIVIKRVEKEVGVPEGTANNIITLVKNSISVLGNQGFINLVKNIFDSINGGDGHVRHMRGGGKFSLVNVAYKIESCITFAKFIKQGIEVCIEGYTLSKSITSTASNRWAMDAHQLNSLLSITNNYNSYDYKADIINKIMVVYKKKHYESFELKLAEKTPIKDYSGKPINLIQLMLDIRRQSTNVTEQGGFEEVYYPKKDLVRYLDKQAVLDPREKLTLFLLKTKANINDTTNDVEFERIYTELTSGGRGVIEIRRESNGEIHLNETFLRKISKYFEVDDRIKEYLNDPKLTFHDDDKKKNSTTIHNFEEFKKLFVELQSLSSTQNDFDEFIIGLNELSEFIKTKVIQVFNNYSTACLISEKLCNEKFYSELCIVEPDGPPLLIEDEKLENCFDKEEYGITLPSPYNPAQSAPPPPRRLSRSRSRSRSKSPPRRRSRSKSPPRRQSSPPPRSRSPPPPSPPSSHKGGSAVKTHSKKTDKRSILFRKYYNKKLNKILNFKMPFFKKIQLGGGGPYDKIKIKLIKITNGNTINYELIKKVISEALDINIENSEIDTILNNLKIYKYIDQKTFLDFIMLIEFNNKNKTTRDFLKDTIDDIQKPNNFTLKRKKPKRPPMWKTIFAAAASGTWKGPLSAVFGFVEGSAAAAAGARAAAAAGWAAFGEAAAAATFGGGGKGLSPDNFFSFCNDIFTTLKKCSNKIYTFDFNDDSGLTSGYRGGNRIRVKKTKRYKIKGRGKKTKTKKTKEDKDIEYKDIDFSNRKYPEFLYYTLKNDIDAINKECDFLVQDTEVDKNISATEKLYKIFTSYDTYIFNNTIRFQIKNPNSQGVPQVGGALDGDVGWEEMVGCFMAEEASPWAAVMEEAEPKTQQEQLEYIFGLIFDGIEIIGNLNDTREGITRIAMIAEGVFQLIGKAITIIPKCKVQASAVGAAVGLVAGPPGAAAGATGAAAACMTTAVLHSYNQLKSIAKGSKYSKIRLFGGIFSVLNNYRKTMANKIGNIFIKYSIYQDSPLLLEPGATPEQIEKQKKVYYKKLLLLNSHLSFILDTNYYIDTILEANNISADIFNELCDDTDVQYIISKISDYIWQGVSSGQGEELPRALNKIVELIFKNLTPERFNELYNFNRSVLTYVLNLILFKNISQYIFFVVFGGDMSSYSLQIALFKSIFKESSEVQLSLYLKLIENILYTDYFSGVMNCIIKIYIDDKITNYIPISIEMPKEKEEDLKTKQKKHMEQKLQQKKDHEFTAADRKLIGDLMEEAMGKIVPIGTVPIEAPPAAVPAVAAPAPAVAAPAPAVAAPAPAVAKPGSLPSGLDLDADVVGSDDDEPLPTRVEPLPTPTPKPAAEPPPDLNKDPYSPVEIPPVEIPLVEMIRAFAKKQYHLGPTVAPPPVAEKEKPDTPAEKIAAAAESLPFPVFAQGGGGGEGTKTITAATTTPGPQELVLRLRGSLKDDFLQFPDLDKMDWENKYDEELYKVANYIYNVISNETNLETRTFMISTIYHNYLSELITTL